MTARESDAPLSVAEIRRIEDLQARFPGLVEHVIVWLQQAALAPGDAFIDVGARDGFHTRRLAETVGPTGRGIAIDADPAAIAALEASLAADGVDSVALVPAAAFDAPGEAQFHRRVADPGWSSLYAQHAPQAGAEAERFDVALRRVDDIVDELGLIGCRFMKLDIEHAEVPALRGARRLLKTQRPVVVFENALHRAAQLNGYTAEDFFDFFTDIDYAPLDLFGRPMTLERWRSDETLPTYHLALPGRFDEAAAWRRAHRQNAALRTVLAGFERKADGGRAAPLPIPPRLRESAARSEAPAQGANWVKRMLRRGQDRS